MVVCGDFRARGHVLPRLEAERIAFVAPLTSRSDLEWLIRGLHLHPNVGHVVLCGDDPHVVGESLLALWTGGLGGDGRISGPRGRLCSEFDPAAIDALRKDVQVWDWRDEPFAEVARGLTDLPLLHRSRDPKSLAEPMIPERKTFLSRRTSFPIFASDVGDSWLQLLNLTLRIGAERETRRGERSAEALNTMVTIGLPVIAEDLEVEPVEPENFPSFLDFDRDDFERYYRRFQDRIDSLDAISERLARSPDLRPTSVLVGEARTHPLPNLVSASFDRVDDRLFGSFVLRSVDVYTEWPLEAMALVRLQGEIAAHLGLEAGASTLVAHSVRLRDVDWDRGQRVLSESFKRPLPLQVDHSGIFLFGNDGGEARAMLLDHNASTIYWEDAFSTPEDLSWYIVDVMPWLLPQHIRYVGQECSTLKRAIREGECYEQG